MEMANSATDDVTTPVDTMKWIERKWPDHFEQDWSSRTERHRFKIPTCAGIGFVRKHIQAYPGGYRDPDTDVLHRPTHCRHHRKARTIVSLRVNVTASAGGSSNGPESATRSLRCRQSVDTSERALIAACLICDEDAIAALIAAHRPVIVRLARARVGTQDVDDVCQDVYLRVFARLSTFEYRSRLSTWIYRVALNVIRNRQRTARRRRYDAHVPLDEVSTHDRFPALVDSATPASLWEASDRRRRLRLAIRELPWIQRRALMLWIYRDSSLPAIARSTGLSVPVARRTLQQARRRLRTSWTIGLSGAAD